MTDFDQEFNRALAAAQKPPTDYSHEFDTALAARSEPDVGKWTAAGRGAAQGLSFGFSDELRGLAEAGGLGRDQPAGLGPVLKGAYKYWTGDPEAEQKYNAAVEHARHLNEVAQAQHPYAYGTGEVAGSLPAMAVLPAGELAEGAGIGAKMLQGAKVGAEYGALQGAGTGTDAQSRTLGSAVGAGAGLVGGAASPVVGGALEYLAGRTIKPAWSLISGWMNPEKQAAMRLGASLEADRIAIEAGKAKGMTGADWAAARSRGEPVTLADLGASHTQALLRSAANTSPDARNAIESVIQQRFYGQAERAADDVRNLVAGGANAHKTADQIVAEYDHARSPLYRKTYEDGDKSIMTPLMERMMGSPLMTGAMKRALGSGQDRAILNGYGTFNPGVTFEGGVLKFTGRGPNGRETFPNLQYWDAVKRELDDIASSAGRSGNNDLAGRAGQMARMLRGELDKEVPSYQAARDVAADFFGTKNALEAGQKLAGTKVDPQVLQRLMQKMSPEERDLFREGYASDWASRVIENYRYNQDVSKALLGSPADVKRAQIVFGNEGLAKLQARQNLEQIMDGARKALGNSTTARQLIEAGLAGGATGAAIGSYFGGEHGAGIGALAGAGALATPAGAAKLFGKSIGAGAERLIGYVDQRTAARVAELLVSDDRDKVQRGLEMAARNRKIAEGLKQLANRAVLATGLQQIPSMPTRAEGGRINDFHRARYAYMIKKQGGGPLDEGESWQPGQEEQPAPAAPPPAPFDTEHFNEPFGELKPHEPRPTERFTGNLQDVLSAAGANPYSARHMAEGLTGVAGMVPPIGVGMSMADLIDAQRKHDIRAAIPAAIGAIPIVGRARGVAKAAEEALEPAMRRGLSFPEEQAAERLRLKVQREEKARTTGAELPGQPANERTVIKAPKGSDLPDFVAGKITPQDWVKRTEQMLTPEEIHKSAKWYDEIYDNFLQQTKGNEELARKYMRGWLVAQQNVDVSGAMRNTLLQREQILRGVPEEQMIAAGMPNPTLAARRVMQGRDIEQGVGQKIADFVDSAEGSDTRAWMGHHPHGGSPFVVDVHTARDTGMVDQELVNHLTRLGYDKKGIAKLKTDLGTSPTATQYENRASFGRELTDYLNKKNWMGRSDWTPKEVQAVGWMGMTKLTANKAEDVVTGLGSQMRHLSMEVAPGEGSPWAAKYGDRFSALSPADQYKITHAMTQDAVERASQLAGIDVRDIVHGTGGWMNFQNPSTVAQVFSSPQGAEIAANALGHMLQQTEVWANKVKPLTANPKGFAVDIMASGDHRLGTDEGLREMWGKIMAADPTGKLFQGYQPIVGRDGRVGIRALIDRGGAKTKADLENAVSGPVEKVLKSLPGEYQTQFHEAEITKARNDWTRDKDGKGYTSRLVDLLGRDPAADLNRHGQELEEQFRQAIEAAEARAAGAKAKARGGVASYARGGRVTYRWPLATAPPPIRQWYEKAAR